MFPTQTYFFHTWAPFYDKQIVGTQAVKLALIAIRINKNFLKFF